MPSPASALKTLRPDLGGSFTEFDLMKNLEGLIWREVALPIISMKQAGTFGKIKLAQLLQSKRTRRAPTASYGRGNWEFEDVQFAAEEHGWEEALDNREAEMYADFFRAEQLAVARAASSVLTNLERRVADLLFNTSTWTGSALTTAATAAWTDYANADPAKDVENAVQKVWSGSGLWPNALILNRIAFRHARNCTKILDRIKYQGFQDVRASAITPQALAQVFDVDRVIVANSARATNNAGQSAAIGQIWSGSYAMVARVAETDDIREPCVARVIHWPGVVADIEGMVEQYSEPKTDSEIYRYRTDTDEMVLYAQAGHLISGIGA